MDLPSQSSERTGVRFSESPALSPKIVDGPSSPVRSVHVDTMEGNQTVKHLNRGDFFDDNTSDEEDVAPRRSRSSDIQYKHSSLNSETLPPDPTVQYINEPIKRQPPPRPPRPLAQNSAVSQSTEPALNGLVYPKESYIQTGGWLSQPSLLVPDTLAARRMAKNAQRPASLPPNMALSGVISSNKYEQVANIHAMTLEYLLRSENEQQPSVSGDDTERSKSETLNRKIVTLPSPIDIEKRKENDPIVRTPYPIGIRKSLVRQSHISIRDAPNEAILALTLHRRAGHKACRVSELKIPASPEYVPISSSPGTNNEQSERHFETLDFDDAHFFLELRRAYADLAGSLHSLSARGLRHIKVSHSNACAHYNTSSSCRHDLPRSPLRIVSQGLADSFSEANLMTYFCRPRLGKAQYMWVHWAHRIASTPSHLLPPAPMPSVESPSLQSTSASMAALRVPGEEKSREGGGGVACVAGLEFVEGWKAWKIAFAVAVAIILAVMATLLWILIGVPEMTGVLSLNDAASRIIPGCLLGLLVFALAMTIVILWACVSWLVE